MKGLVPLMTATVLAAAFSTAVAGQAARPGQPVPPRDPSQPANQIATVGTATVTGVVTMGANGQPARKVRVNLSGAELRGNRTTATDDQGRFSFTALPAGRFNLSATKPGYLSVTYGQRRPGTPGTPIQLADGQTFHAQLTIPRGSVITGTVLDEHGETSTGTPVRAMRYVIRNGQRTLQSSGTSTTDDRGIYRIFNLQPGEYVVCATPRNTTVSDANRVRMEMQALRQNLQTLAAARGREDQIRAIENRIAAVQAAMPPEQPGEAPPGYAPICYPGTPNPAEAPPIPVGIGEERMGIDFQLQLVPMGRVEGSVINASGAPLQNIQLRLQDVTSLGPPTIHNTRAGSDGTFRFAAVPPGQYRLTARAQFTPPRPAPAAQTAAGRAERPAQRPQPVVHWAAADVLVDGRDVTNVVLALQPGMTVSGHITFEATTQQPPADLTRMRVSLTPGDLNPMPGGSGTGRVDASGRFTIENVVPGRYRLTAGGSGGWSIESASVSGLDAVDFPFEVKPGQNVGGVTITMTDRRTELTGIVVDEKNQPAVDYTLVIFPSDEQYWSGPSRRIQTVRPGTDGRYTVRNLPPGEYRIATVLDIEPGAASDPDFLRQIESATMKITLQPGEKKQQDLRLR